MFFYFSGGGNSSNVFTNNGSGSRPSTPLRHLINDSSSVSSATGKLLSIVSTTTLLDLSSFNVTAQNLTNVLSTPSSSQNFQSLTSTTVVPNNSPTTLINNDIDTVMAAWKRQMELTPISLPPRNIQTLPVTVFISYDFVCWLMRTVNNLDVLDEALAFAERLVIIFIFFIYYFFFKVEANRIRQIMPIRYKTGVESNIHIHDIDSCKSSSERQSRESGSDIRRRRKTRTSYTGKNSLASKQRFRFGSFIYCIVTHSLETDISRVDMSGKILISLSRPCPQLIEKLLISKESETTTADAVALVKSETDSPSSSTVTNTGTCRFRSKSFVLEFASSSSFTIRNPENQNTEWGKVIFLKNFFII